METLDEEAESEESSESAEADDIEEMNKTKRLVEWNVELLARIVNVDEGNGLGDENNSFFPAISILWTWQGTPLELTKSVAEQKSVDIAWDMLMSEEYAALRACIYQTEEDLQRFRQLVVNTVTATDIVDSELQALRKSPLGHSLFQRQFGRGIVG
eukprot:scaffold6650_cov116-Cylindrotheca_fusiformis.AAC.3